MTPGRRLSARNRDAGAASGIFRLTSGVRKCARTSSSLQTPDARRLVLMPLDPLGERVAETQRREEIVWGAVGSDQAPPREARTERSLPVARDDRFGGEELADTENERYHALCWCVEN